VPIGPLLVLRLDRITQFGAVPAILTVAVLVLWGVAGAMLASSWWRRPSRNLERSTLPGAGADEPEPGGGAEAPGSVDPPGAMGRPGPPGGAAG